MAHKLLYNVTTLVDHSIHDDWLSWVTKVHIPQVMATHAFLEFKMSKILGSDESQGINYALQFVSHSMVDFLRYRDIHLKEIQQQQKDQFGEKYVSFSTLMEIVHESGEQVFE